MSRAMTGVVLMASLIPGLAGCGVSPPLAVPTAASPVSLQSYPIRPPEPTPSVYLADIVLSGVVSEAKTGMPIERVRVYCEPCGESTHNDTYTDAKGFYSFKGVWGTFFSINATKDGYADPPGTPYVGFSGPGWRNVRISGDTTFDIQLVGRD